MVVKSFLAGLVLMAATVVQAAPAARAPLDISLIELIANPARFDGKQVRVTGYLVREFEGDAVYLHRDDYDHGIRRNGLWLTFSKDGADLRCKTLRYAFVQGKFVAKNRGHLGLWSGAIEGIASCGVSR
jgi:hypothetical protein